LTPQSSWKPTIYVMGDSHASNLIPSLIAALPDHEVRYLGDSLLETSMMGEPSGDLSRCTSEACIGAELDRRLEFLNRHLRSEDALVLAFTTDMFRYQSDSPSGANGTNFVDFSQGHPRTFSASDPANLHFEDALGRFAKLADAKRSRLIIVDGLPKLCSHAEYERGKARDPWNPCEGLRSESLADRQGSSDMYHRVSAESGAVILDPHPYLCPDEVCSANIDGKLWSLDGSPHFINTNPKLLESFFRSSWRG